MAVRFEIPIEIWLKNNGTRHMPGFSKSLFERYCDLKIWLIDNIYPHVGEGAASADKYFYNKHNLDHFNDVLKCAGDLLGLDSQKCSTKGFCLTDYETFLLMCAILVHDIGMVEGRDDHEKKAFKYLSKSGEVAIPDVMEKRIIANIAEVHGGKSIAGDKDTIGLATLSNNEEFGDERNLRLKILAAIAKLADELADNKNRAARIPSGNGNPAESELPKGNEVYHYYSLSIRSLNILPKNNMVKISYAINKNVLSTKFGKLDSEVYLIDEIYSRLNKMHNEKIYCNRFIAPITYINLIRVTITIVDDDYKVLESKDFDIEEKGYPENNLNLSSDQIWIGETLAQVYA